MIYFDSDISEVVEATYLSESITTKIADSNIFVNPKNIKYLVGKIVIINEPGYSESDMALMKGNSCKVILRYWYPGDYEYEPYILRYNPRINWSGSTVNNVDEINNSCNIIADRSVKLMFPKVKNYDIKKILDEKGNLSSMGWALQQVGVNVVRNKIFTNLDLLKTKKVLL